VQHAVEGPAHLIAQRIVGGLGCGDARAVAGDVRDAVELPHRLAEQDEVDPGIHSHLGKQRHAPALRLGGGFPHRVGGIVGGDEVHAGVEGGAEDGVGERCGEEVDDHVHSVHQTAQGAGLGHVHRAAGDFRPVRLGGHVRLESRGFQVGRHDIAHHRRPHEVVQGHLPLHADTEKQNAHRYPTSREGSP